MILQMFIEINICVEVSEVHSDSNFGLNTYNKGINL